MTEKLIIAGILVIIAAIVLSVIGVIGSKMFKKIKERRNRISDASRAFNKCVDAGREYDPNRSNQD